MKYLARLIGATLALFAIMSPVQAADGELELSVTYRERIALPPDAQLEVQLLDVSPADAAARRIASQRVVMTSVPMSVVLPYDPAIIEDGALYAVVADIWSGDSRIFRTLQSHPVFTGADGPVELVLSIVPEEGVGNPPRLPIAGIEWAVTEIAGEPWSNDDPATLTIDDEMKFSIFGGCNRFSGTLSLSGDEIAFPENFAGTLMACPTDVEALERRFLAALRDVSRFVRYGAGLILTDADGRALLHFVHRPE